MNQNSLAHSLWKKHLLSKKDIPLSIVDATCGNGHDSFFLSEFENSHLHCIDIQKEAIEQTKKKLGNKKKSITYHLRSHEDLSFIKEQVDLITYNLGYLPGSDKEIITTPETTLASLKSAVSKLSSNGIISIMIYTGHDGGIREKEAIMNFTKKLPLTFEVSTFKNPEKKLCPELVIIKSLI